MEAKKIFSRLGFGYVIFFAATIAIQYLIVLIVTMIHHYVMPLLFTNELSMMMSQAAMYLGAFPIMLLWMQYIPAWKKTGKGRITAREFLILLLFCFGITYIGNFVGGVLMEAVSQTTGTPVDNPVDSMINELSPLMLFVYVVVVAPVMEEVVFRKLLIDRVIPYGQKTAIILSGIAFGLFHGNFFQFFYACSMGMVFAYIYTRTGTIRYGVLLHAAINFVGGFLSSILLKGMEQEAMWANIGMGVLGLFSLFAMIAAIVLFIARFRKIRFFPGWAEDGGKTVWSHVFKAPGVWAYIIVCVIMFIYF